MHEVDSDERLIQEMRAAVREAVANDVPDRQDELELLAIAPEWPERVAARALGRTPRSRDHDDGDSRSALAELVEGGWIEATDAAPPASGTVYSLSRAQRRQVLQVAQSRIRTPGTMLGRAYELARDFTAVSSGSDGPYSLVVQYWCRLLEPEAGSPPGELAIAQRLQDRVDEAIPHASALGLSGSVEAAVWIDAAEPLALAAGGPVRIAWSRAQRALELFHRRIRDLKDLKNYHARAEADAAFEELISDDEHWALHYVGVGGVGKTMFLRHLQSTLADRLKLATARVDFDHLNPNYPLRAPGMLLLSFAEELKLTAPDAATSMFTTLTAAVNKVHADLETAQRAGSDVPLGLAAPGFSLCIALFVDALLAIHRSGRRPVLILDTCEELARVRFDGRLPRTVIETFRILEQLHEQVRAPDGTQPLRIVFSGRRALARSGAGWTWTDEALPERPYLRICPLAGFVRDEARSMLLAFHRAEKGRDGTVPPSLVDGIIKLSMALHHDEFAQLKPVAPAAIQRGEDDRAVRYSPYDLNLYAAWAAAGGITTPEQLLQSGRHYYVRDRIVSRARQDVARWLPHVTVLGHFDAELIRELSGLPDVPLENLWTELRQQEWTEPDRAAAEMADDVPLAFWSVNPNLRERLAAYYHDESPDVWFGARRAVADALEKITVERDWSLLTPSYFVVCMDVLGAEPPRAARWWRAVEAKILDTDAWDWADRMTAALLDPEAHRGRLGQSPAESEPHPLEASVHALRANVQLRLSPGGESLGLMWEGVLKAKGRIPGGPADVMLLRYRAHAGIIATWRYQSGIPSSEDLDEFKVALRRVERLMHILDLANYDPPFVRQALFTELGLIENYVEAMERFRSSPQIPRNKLASVDTRRLTDFFSVLHQSEWLHLYNWRVVDIVDSQGSLHIPQMPLALADHPMPDELEGRAFDWVPPRNMPARRLLEIGRLLESQETEYETEEFRAAAFHAVVSPRNLDEDRLIAQALRLRGADGMSPERLYQLFRSSLALRGEREECAAHMRVPPLYVTVLQVAADSGAIDMALELLQEARQTVSPNETRWIESLAEYLNREFRLVAAPAKAEITMPQAPSRLYSLSAGTRFIQTVSALLHRVLKHSITDQDAKIVQDAAIALCRERDIVLPFEARQLGSLPKGWAPWFARYLLVAHMNNPELYQITKRETLRFLKALYPNGLPDDVAFLANYELPLRAGWVDVLGFNAYYAVVLVLLAAGALAAKSAEHLFFRTPPTALQSTTFFVGAIAAVLCTVLLVALVLLPFTLALLRSVGVLTKYVAFAEEGSIGKIDVTVQARILFRNVRTKRTASRSDYLAVEPYSDLAAQTAAERKPRPADALIRAFGAYVARAAPFPMALVVPPETPWLTATCWEAAFGMFNNVLPTFDLCPFTFHRAGTTSSAREPFPSMMTVLSISSLRDLSINGVFIRSGAKYGTIRTARGLDERPDETVGVLILQAEAVGEPSNVQFSVQAGSEQLYRADDVARLFPNLRLCVVLGFDRSGRAERAASERLSAGLQRAGAADLFRCGVPAVVSIPGLPFETPLTADVVDLVSRLSGRFYRRASWPIQKMARKVQDRIFATCRASAGDEAATELAYDVCCYCAEHVNMSVNLRATVFDRESHVRA